jgi:hypothetical protein
MMVSCCCVLCHGIYFSYSSNEAQRNEAVVGVKLSSKPKGRRGRRHCGLNSQHDLIIDCRVITASSRVT